MEERLANRLTNAPFTMLWACQGHELSIVDGVYDPETQKWSKADISATTTWSRSTTTGYINLDPDEDKDD